MKNYEVMQSFTLKNIPCLDTCVLGALEFLSKEKIPRISIPYKRPLVVGSGNAAITAKIIFKDYDSVFADENNLENNLKKIKSIDGVVIISASGSKHAPIIAKVSKKYKKKLTLITSSKNSPAQKELEAKKDKIYFFPKQREPYTYNTSTYLGMILGKTSENPKKIHDFIENKIDKISFPVLKKFDKYFIIVPPKFSKIRPMINTKFKELFGRQIARDVETSESIKHATTLVPSNELFISFGEKNSLYGKNRLQIPLPKNAGYGSMMAIAYYIIGKIQNSHPTYFQTNLENYCKKASKIFKQKINPIVE